MEFEKAVAAFVTLEPRVRGELVERSSGDADDKRTLLIMFRVPPLEDGGAHKARGAGELKNGTYRGAVGHTSRRWALDALKSAHAATGQGLDEVAHLRPCPHRHAGRVERRPDRRWDT